MEHFDHAIKVRLRRFGQDLGQGALDQGVGAQDAAAHVLQAHHRVHQALLAIVDYDPAHAPAGDQEALGQAAAGENRHLRGEAAHSQVLGAREDKVFVDLREEKRVKNIS